MRVLLTSFPAVAHVLALRPLAAAFVARGDDVALLSAPSAAPLLPPGVRHVVAGPDLDELLALPRPEGERPDGLPFATPDRRLDPWPATLRPPGWEAPGPLTPVRAELALPDARSVPVAPPAGGGPVVLVTLGTLFLDGPTLAGVVDAVTAGGARAVVALPPQLDTLDVARPDRVALRPFGPLGPVLERVDAVVCHAGAATVLAAAIHGRPLVVVPQGADHHVNAAGVVAGGVGLRVAATEGADAIAAATTAVVGTAVMERAAGLARTIAATPGWADRLARPGVSPDPRTPRRRPSRRP